MRKRHCGLLIGPTQESKFPLRHHGVEGLVRTARHPLAAFLDSMELVTLLCLLSPVICLE
jgi:hypothetical protein